MTSWRLAGYALPWETETAFAGAVESVARGAIAPSARNIRLLFATHDGEARAYADTARGTLRIWNDEYGLAFEADIAATLPGASSVARAVGEGMTTGASVYFRQMTGSERDGRRRIVSAAIDHITITAEPAYQETAVWLDDVPIRDRPQEVRASSIEYARHGRQHRTCGKFSGPGQESEPVPSVFDRSPRVPASLNRLLADPAHAAAWQASMRLLEAARSSGMGF
jgi:HK97 family phage prohead protease